MNYKIINFKNNAPHCVAIERADFHCAEVSLNKEDQLFINEIFHDASLLSLKANPNGANTSVVRDHYGKTADAVTGVLAERVCETVLNKIINTSYFYLLPSKSSYDQIDMATTKGQTVEIRSSCIRNGIEFALFCKDRNTNIQYIDVLGPYVTHYKSHENERDLYVRVIFPYDKKDLLARLREITTFTFYITGGATKQMMNDSNYFTIKHLTPKNSDVLFESDYKVIPLGKSYDILEFIEHLNKD